MRSPNETNLSTANCFVHWWVVNRQSPKTSQKSSISDLSLWLIFSLNNPSLDFFSTLPLISQSLHWELILSLVNKHSLQVTVSNSHLRILSAPNLELPPTSTKSPYLFSVLHCNALQKTLWKGQTDITHSQSGSFWPFFFSRTCLQKCIKHLSHSQALRGGRTFLSIFNYRYNKVLFHSEGSYAWQPEKQAVGLQGTNPGVLTNPPTPQWSPFLTQGA